MKKFAIVLLFLTGCSVGVKFYMTSEPSDSSPSCKCNGTNVTEVDGAKLYCQCGDTCFCPKKQ